jgi:hypothetical protein
MFEEYEKKKRKQVSIMRSMMDYVMGFVIFLIGLFFLFRSRFGDIPVNEKLGEPDLLEKMFGGLCLLYGIWRIYRGYQKKYFN